MYMHDLLKSFKRRWGIWVVVAVMACLACVLGMICSVSSMSSSDVNKLVAEINKVKPPYDPAKVRWVWLDGGRNMLGERYGLCASYRAWSNTIAIPRYHQGMIHDSLMLPTYCHELTHAKQRNRLGLFWYLWKKTLQRDQLEAEAVSEEERVQFDLWIP